MNLEVYLKILQKYKNFIHIKKHATAFKGLSYSGASPKFSKEIEKVISTSGMISR